MSDDEPEESQEQWEARVSVSRDAGWDAPTCFSCKWWTRHNGNITANSNAYCHRHAPSPHLVKDDDGDYLGAHWPITEADDWCGDHAAIPDSAKPV